MLEYYKIKLKELYDAENWDATEEYCQQHSLNMDEVWAYFRYLDTPEKCRGCKWYKNYDLLYPCNRCNRNHLIQDMYEEK